jgi:hypothetical protein
LESPVLYHHPESLLSKQVECSRRDESGIPVASDIDTRLLDWRAVKGALEVERRILASRSVVELVRGGNEETVNVVQ